MGKEMKELEEGKKLNLDFTKLAQVAAACPDVIPAAVQDEATKEVILVAYVNERALRETLTTGILTLWSTSRNELWVKGKTSGNYFSVREIRVNCEQNSLLFVVSPRGDSICHTTNQAGRARNCFYRRIKNDAMELENTDP
jgi:phosphoribosyl-AMP cyclohydrolase